MRVLFLQVNLHLTFELITRIFTPKNDVESHRVKLPSFSEHRQIILL
jgi:hypothetical protein